MTGNSSRCGQGPVFASLRQLVWTPQSKSPCDAGLCIESIVLCYLNCRVHSGKVAPLCWLGDMRSLVEVLHVGRNFAVRIPVP